MDYGARFYDPALGRFVSADSVVPEPGNPQALNRYAYVLGNPLRYVDPTGHKGEEPSDLFNQALKGQQERSRCILLWCFPQADPLRVDANPVAEESITQIPTVSGPVLAKGDGIGKKIRNGLSKAAAGLGLCQGILSFLCNETAHKAAETVDDVAEKLQYAGKLPLPPNGKGLPWFGQQVGWGEGINGGLKSLERAKNITVAEVQALRDGVSKAYVTALRDGYLAQVESLAQNGQRASPNAAERAVLLTRILELWEQ